MEVIVFYPNGVASGRGQRFVCLPPGAVGRNPLRVGAEGNAPPGVALRTTPGFDTQSRWDTYMAPASA